MTNEQINLVKRIIIEELVSIPLDLPKAEKDIPGTIVVSARGKDLVPASVVEPIEPDGEYMSDDFKSNIETLVAHHDFSPEDQTQEFKGMKDLSQIVAERLSINNRQKLFKIAHEAKMRIKQLREAPEELSSLRHAIISEYIEGISSYIDNLTKYEKLVKEHLGMVVEKCDNNLNAGTLLKSVTSNVSTNINNLSENESEEELQEYLTEIAIPFIRFLSKIEFETRFDLK